MAGLAIKWTLREPYHVSNVELLFFSCIAASPAMIELSGVTMPIDSWPLLCPF